LTQVHSDDISNVLILNKKAIANQESQLFKAELEKFRPHQNRILQANHKQSSLLKELTRTYSDLLKDKRVRSEQSKYDAFSRQRNTVMTKYRRVYQNFNDLIAGLSRAQTFYAEMKDTVSSLQKNVETFVQNRRGEGGQLLSRIEQNKSQGADQEQQRLKDLMDRMSVDPSGSPVSHGSGSRKKSIPPPLTSTPGYHPPSSSGPGAHPAYNPAASPPITPRYPITTAPGQQAYMSPQQSYGAAPSNGYQQPQPPRRESYQSFGAQSHQQPPPIRSSAYNPAQHNQYNPVSPPAHQQFFSPPPILQQQQQQQQQQPWGQPPAQQQWNSAPQPNLPQGYVPPPPPPGPPPSQNVDYSHFSQGNYPSGPGGYSQPRGPGHGQQGGSQGGGQGQGQGDPWAGLSGWK
jgi:hypothetical protein